MKKFTDLVEESILDEGMTPHHKKAKMALQDVGIMSKWDDTNWDLEVMKGRGKYYGFAIDTNNGTKYWLIDTSSSYHWRRKTGSNKDVFFKGSLEEVVAKVQELIATL